MAAGTDGLGNTLSGASPDVREFYGKALTEFQIYIGDPVATVGQALEDSPGFVMGHALRAWLHLLGTEPSGVPVARETLAAARALPATEQERAHLTAIAHVVAGDWWAASRVLEDASVAQPRDALALQAGHLIDFFTGNRMLRDRPARALPAWSTGMPGYHAVLSMHAFGLEETRDYSGAEATGRRAVEFEPRDGFWSADQLRRPSPRVTTSTTSSGRALRAILRPVL